MSKFGTTQGNAHGTSLCCRTGLYKTAGIRPSDPKYGLDFLELELHVEVAAEGVGDKPGGAVASNLRWCSAKRRQETAGSR